MGNYVANRPYQWIADDFSGAIMSEENLSRKEELSIYQQEYERLLNVVHDYSRSSFDKFKLLGALGFLFAWDPILKCVDRLSGGQVSLSYQNFYLLFSGFVVVLLISAIISVRDFLKKSIVVFNHSQLASHGQKLRTLLQIDASNSALFNHSGAWASWFAGSHRRIAGLFCGLYSQTILVFPMVVLACKAGWGFALAYFLTWSVISIFPALAVMTLHIKGFM
jgi:hypothetical protein